MGLQHEHRRAVWQFDTREYCDLATRQERVKIRYRGAIIPGWTFSPSWVCYHAHTTREAAQACADAALSEYSRVMTREHQRHDRRVRGY